MNKTKRIKIHFLILLILIFASCGSEENFGIDSNTSDLGEEFSGGDTTVFITTSSAFKKPAANLSFQEKSDFQIGNSFFEQDWVTAPSITTARDGLGPVFNARACGSCHSKDGRGAFPEEDEEPTALLVRLSIGLNPTTKESIPDPNYGGQINNRSILNIDSETSVRVSYEEIKGEYADGEVYYLRKPIIDYTQKAYGEFNAKTKFSARIAPQIVGLGLLEALSEETILEFADPKDEDNNGISGKPNYVWDVEAQTQKLGRFGWKANQPNIKQQVSGAFLGDIGITSSLFPDENCTESQEDCMDAINGGQPEIEDSILEKVVFYSKTLAVPARRDWLDAKVVHGKKIFNETGCASCHRPSMQTSADFPIKALADQTIFPYTDLLLHDMGSGLADKRPDFEANGQEWRTPPLWGIGLVEKVNGHTDFLHDARARNLEEAILWHDGEAKSSQDKFINLSKSDREDLITFLNSL